MIGLDTNVLVRLLVDDDKNLQAVAGRGRRAPRRSLPRKPSELPEVDALVRALESFKAARDDFADCLIQEQACAVGCDRVATFDRALLKEAGFTAP
ncbi:MAG TPA: hypothetical protein VMK66_01490 [Myxococcales bacterium]|nr:hypothetical protein [Myxococcales bacterium]